MKKILYITILKNDPGILSSMSATDTKYQTFYNNTAASNIGTFEKVNSFIHWGDYSDAQVLNSGISPTNLMEINRQTVNTIFINSWAKGRFNLTGTEYNTLCGIAAQQPLLGGSGVYSARVMVGQQSARLSSTRTVDDNHSNIIATPIVGKIYPNPAKDEAYIDYQLQEGQTGKVMFFNITGQLLSEYTMFNGSNKLIINTERYKSGIYFYRVLVNNNIIENDKLIIIK